jgi:glycosyltransferase involved in cell wall biosynthesis
MPEPDNTRRLPVSVVIPAYERERMVARAVGSARRQDPPPDEVIVVDDGSADGTAVAAEAAGARVVRHPRNRGRSAARNTGLRAAGNPWVALLDCDDEWLPGHLAGLWELRDGHAFVAASCLMLADEDGPGRLHGPGTERPVVLRSPRKLAFPMNFVAPSATMLRRDTALAVAGFDEALTRSEDLDLWLRLLERGTAAVGPQATVLYHVHGDQTTADSAAMERSHLEVLQRMTDRDWWTPRLVRRFEGTMAWDGMRHALAERRLEEAIRHALRGLAHPQRIAGIGAMLARRRRLRARAARLTRSSSSSAAAC